MGTNFSQTEANEGAINEPLREKTNNLIRNRIWFVDSFIFFCMEDVLRHINQFFKSTDTVNGSPVPTCLARQRPERGFLLNL